MTFPTQVIFKSSKMIPVMIMGKIIDKRVYTATDYALAITISIGVVSGACAEAVVCFESAQPFPFLAPYFFLRRSSLCVVVCSLCFD